MKNGGLGSLPKGLEWINQKPETQSPAMQNEKAVVEKPVESIAIAQPINAVIEQPIKSIINVAEKTHPVKHKTTQTKANTSALAGLPEGYTRATFIVKQEHVDRLKALSFVKKVPIKDLVDQAMAKFLKDKDVTTILTEAIKVMGDSSEVPDGE